MKDWIETGKRQEEKPTRGIEDFHPLMNDEELEFMIQCSIEFYKERRDRDGESSTPKDDENGNCI